MGTRHLIEVRCDGETKIAQYGQWDGYLSGQGVKILEFLKKNVDKKKWRKALSRCKFFKDEDEIHTVFPHLKESSEEQDVPSVLHRDTGSKILDIVLQSKDTLFLVDSRGAGCQYYYIIDMDKNVFHVRNNYGLNEYFKLDDLPDEKYFLKLES
jgi:hypothetical protein